MRISNRDLKPMLQVLLSLLPMAAVLGGVLAAAASAAVVGSPVASGRPGYLAQAVCSLEGEGVGSEYFVPTDASEYPVAFGHLDTCEDEGGALTLRDEGTHDSQPESGPGWSYQAPPGELIAGGVAKLSMTSPGGRTVFGVVTSKGVRQPLASCETSSCSGVHTATVSIPDTEWWLMYAEALCAAPQDQSQCATTGVNAELSLSTATILLHSEATPEATGVEGSLTENPVSGTASIAFTARETEGPGIYRVITSIDGSELSAETPDTDYGVCVADGNYEGALEFAHAVPCPGEVPVRLQLQTQSLSDGPHLVEVTIEDAAGDRSVIFDKTITVENHPGSPSNSNTPSTPSANTSSSPPATTTTVSRGACNGTPCVEAAKLTLTSPAKTLRRKLARSALTLTGSLQAPSGAPIAGAQVQLTEQTAGESKPRILATTRTGTKGHWQIKAPRGPSRVLRVLYYSHQGDTTPAAQASLAEHVPAVISLHAPHTARIGDPLTFAGRLAGGHIPKGGEPVQMEILYDHRWRTIEVLTTNHNGRFHYTYTFTIGGASYKFRAVSVANAGYPFTVSRSAPRRVTVPVAHGG